MVKIIFITIIFFSGMAFAKDLGTIGHTWDILEPNALKSIKKVLIKKEKKGEIDAMNKYMADKTKKYVLNPTAVMGIGKAYKNKAKTWLYDPTFSLSRFLPNEKGEVVLPAGTKANPLKLVKLSKTLIFINGHSKKEVRFAINFKGAKKIILIEGSAINLSNKYKWPFYFDQKGTITKQLSIKNVPTIVAQKGLNLQIQEVGIYG